MFEVPQDISDSGFEYIVWRLDPGQKPGETAWYAVEIVVDDLDAAVRFAIPLGHRAVITRRVRLKLTATEK